MVKCDRCGKEVDLPFRCNYCGGYFCSEHRLPEFHDCPGLYRERRATYTGDWTATGGGYSYQPPRQRRLVGNVFRFSERELRDLGIGLLIIAALPLMWYTSLIRISPLILLGAVLIFAAAFLLHELAHKFAAQRLGYWAEFRLNQMGLMITLLSFLSPMKIVAPGAVMISGLMYGDDYGKISLAGPLTNIGQALLFLLLRLTTQNQILGLLSLLGVMINTTLALFNLLPFGVFDGAKIMRWDWRVWLAVTAPTVLLYIYSYL